MDTNTVRKVREQLPVELQQTRPAGQYTLEQLYRLAQVFHESGLFEDVKDAAQALVKIIRGQEMGVPPTTAMHGMDIIAKRVFIKPWLIAAKINSCGYGSYVVLEATATACTIAFRRKLPGHGWQDLPPVCYTIEEAKLHGLVSRSPHWKNAPENMLYMRAMGRGGVRYFPELFAGLEPPPDDVPVSEATAQQTIAELWPSPVHHGATSRPPAPESLARAPAAPPPAPDWQDLPDEGWRTRLATLLESFAQEDFFTTKARKALHSTQTAPGEGLFLLEQAETRLALDAAAQEDTDAPQP